MMLIMFAVQTLCESGHCAEERHTRSSGNIELLVAIVAVDPVQTGVGGPVLSVVRIG